MKLIKIFFGVCIALLLIFNVSNVASAEPKELYAEGECRLGENDTRADAKRQALADAKRKILEQIGVNLTSYTETKDFELVVDQVLAEASAYVQIKHQEVKFLEDGSLCKAYLIVVYDPDKKITASPGNGDDKKHVDESLLRMAGFEEFGGHYYKIFEDGMTWIQARDYCKAMGGYLVVITSDEEQSFVERLIKKGKKNNYWVGGFRTPPTESEWIKNVDPLKWQWVNGETFDYTNWEKNQPDFNDKMENVMMIRKETGLWNDILYNAYEKLKEYNLSTFGTVCEWDSASNVRY